MGGGRSVFAGLRRDRSVFGGLRRDRAAGDFEDTIHFVDQERVLVVRELAVDVHLLEFGGDRFGAGFAIFFDVGGFARGARQGVDQVGENAGVAAEFVIDAAGIEVTESAEKAGDGELKNGSIKFGSIKIGKEVKSGFLVIPEVFEPILLEQPVLVMRA